MNYEQVLKLPTTRQEFIVDTFTAKKLIYAEGLGIFGYEQRASKVHEPRPGTTNPIISAPYARVVFIYAPTEEYFLNKIVIEDPLEIVRFDFREAMKSYKPNTGLTVAKDKKGLVLFLLNYRKEPTGTEKITLLGLNEQFVRKEIDPLSPYCSVTKDESTGIITVSPL